MASTDPLLGSISMFAGNFAPRGWAFCAGQLLPISQNTALFSLLGTTYGGDGRTTFGLPDLRGRAPIGFGRGIGLSDYQWGQKGGRETNTLTINTLPNHNHVANTSVTVVAGANSGDSETASPDNNSVIATPGALDGRTFNSTLGFTSAAPNVSLGGVTASATTTVGATGNQQPVNNIQPILAINYIIALVGVFPSRS